MFLKVIMNKTNSSEYGKRIKFLIAVMTKDYANAEVLGKSILEKEPTNNIIRQFLTLIESANLVNKIGENESDLNDESTSESGESDSEPGNDDLNGNINSADFNYKIDLHSQQFHSTTNTPLPSKKKLSTLFNFKGIYFERNIYRVFPIKFHRKT